MLLLPRPHPAAPEINPSLDRPEGRFRRLFGDLSYFADISKAHSFAATFMEPIIKFSPLIVSLLNSYGNFQIISIIKQWENLVGKVLKMGAGNSLPLLIGNRFSLSKTWPRQDLYR